MTSDCVAIWQMSTCTRSGNNQIILDMCTKSLNNGPRPSCFALRINHHPTWNLNLDFVIYSFYKMNKYSSCSIKSVQCRVSRYMHTIPSHKQMQHRRMFIIIDYTVLVLRFRFFFASACTLASSQGLISIQATQDRSRRRKW